MATSGPEWEDDPDTHGDYEFIKLIAKGSFGQTWLVMHLTNHEPYCIKEVDIPHLKCDGYAFTLLRERRAGRALWESDWICKTYASFIRVDKCYFVMELVENDQLHRYIVQNGGFRDVVSRFYTAQIILGLEYLKQKQWVHRDMATKNILLDRNWHVKIADFGLAKRLGDPKAREGSPFDSTRVGTIRIRAPEVFKMRETTCSSDLWALGCAIYEMRMNSVTFKGDMFHTKQENIMLGYYEALDDDADPLMVDLLKKLLVPNPTERLGADSIDDLKAHPWFAPIHWESLHLTPPPYLDENPDTWPAVPVNMLPARPPPPTPVAPSPQIGLDPMDGIGDLGDPNPSPPVSSYHSINSDPSNPNNPPNPAAPDDDPLMPSAIITQPMGMDFGSSSRVRSRSHHLTRPCSKCSMNFFNFFRWK